MFFQINGQDEVVRMENEHSGSGDVVMKLKLENQQLQEESTLAQNLSESRQKQLNTLNERIEELNSKYQEVVFFMHFIIMIGRES